MYKKQYNVYEKVDYYEKLLKVVNDPQKNAIYSKRIKELKNSPEYTIGGSIFHFSNKKTKYAENKGWKPDKHWEGD